MLHIFFSKTFFFFSEFFDEKKVQKNSIFFNRNFCSIIDVFTATFDQFNASLLNKSIHLFFTFYLTYVSYLSQTLEW